MPNPTTPITRIIRAYRQQLGEDAYPLPYPDFAAQLSEPLQPLSRVFAPETIHYWEAGRYLPADIDLHALSLFAKPNTWQWRFAQDIKAAKYPGVHTPASEVAKAILGITAE